MPRSRSSGALSIVLEGREVSVSRAVGAVVLGQRLGDGGRQRRLTVVDVTDGADVNMRLRTLELLLSHVSSSLQGFAFAKRIANKNNDAPENGRGKV